MPDTLQMLMAAKAGDSVTIAAVDSVAAHDSIAAAKTIPAYWNSDSLMAQLSSKAVPAKPLLFTDIYHGHELKQVNTEPLSRNNVSPIWIFPILLIIIVIFTWLKVFYSKYFSQMFQAFTNNNLANQIVRDENILIQRASVYLSFSFNLIAALFLYLISIHYGWQMGGIGAGFSRFLFFAIVVSAIYTMKFLILKLCGWLFEQDREMATYIFNIFLINNILGIALLPFISVLAFNKHAFTGILIIICLISASLAFFYRLYRGILVGINSITFSPLYLFLYLCTLEIAPLLVLMRFVIQ